nr:hypothetical protein [Phytoactinopolyspora endophytica]
MSVDFADADGPYRGPGTWRHVTPGRGLAGKPVVDLLCGPAEQLLKGTSALNRLDGSLGKAGTPPSWIG